MNTVTAEVVRSPSGRLYIAADDVHNLLGCAIEVARRAEHPAWCYVEAVQRQFDGLTHDAEVRLPPRRSLLGLRW